MFNIVAFEELTSTNKYALSKINDYADGTVIRAKIQTAGRGRFSRKWVSDKKDNCYISFILKPDMYYKDNFQNLTQYLSIVLCEELITYGISPQIKWPNDVQINGKKIAGILSETSFTNELLNGIVLGIGVNLNLTENDLENIDIPATSLSLEIAESIDSDIFIKKLVQRFFENYEKFLEKGFSEFRAEYISLSNFIGKEITIKNPEVQNLGIALNVANDGTLELLTENGEIKKIVSGDMII